MHLTFRDCEQIPSCAGQIEFILLDGAPQIERSSNDFPFSLCGVYGVFMERTCLAAAAATSVHATYTHRHKLRGFDYFPIHTPSFSLSLSLSLFLCLETLYEIGEVGVVGVGGSGIK